MAIAKPKKIPTTMSHQRRIGAHQKQTKHFMNTYWPYLPLFGLAALVIIVAGGRILGPAGAVLGSTSLVLAGASLLI